LRGEEEEGRTRERKERGVEKHEELRRRRRERIVAS